MTKRLSMAAAALMLATMPSGGHAQLDIGHSVASDVIVIIQLDEIVGMAWADGDPATPCVYDEYWFLTPDYVYPGAEGAGQTIETELQVMKDGPNLGASKQFFEFAAERLGAGKRIASSVIEEDHCGADGF